MLDSDRLDLAPAVDAPRGIAVLLHPHPRFGGDRFHPVVATLFERLPHAGIAAARFDFSSAEVAAAAAETVVAVDAAADRWPGLPCLPRQLLLWRRCRRSAAFRLESCSTADSSPKAQHHRRPPGGFQA